MACDGCKERQQTHAFAHTHPLLSDFTVECQVYLGSQPEAITDSSGNSTWTQFAEMGLCLQFSSESFTGHVGDKGKIIEQFDFFHLNLLMEGETKVRSSKNFVFSDFARRVHTLRFPEP